MHSRIADVGTGKTEKLDEVTRELNQAKQENESFIYRLSHDLRSPLVSLQGFSQELASVAGQLRELLSQPDVPLRLQQRGLALVDDDMGESIAFLQSNAERLARMIEGLLRLSRAGRAELRRQTVDVQSTIREIVASMTTAIEKKGARISMTPMPAAWGDPSAVAQIFTHLIANALTFLDCNRSGTIAIGCTEVENTPIADAGRDFHTYYVRDNGLGIDERHRAKLFQAFQRFHPHVAEGEGIGLSLTRRIVERQGGKIWCDSVAGAGSTFFVVLPGGPTETNSTLLTEPLDTHGDNVDETTAAGSSARGR